MRITLRNKKGYQAPSNGEETQRGHGEGVELSGSLPPRSATSSGHEREGNEPGADETESDWTTVASPCAKLFLRGVSSGLLKYVACGSALSWTTARYVSLPVCYPYPRRSPVPHRTKASIYQSYFFLIPNTTRLFTAISRCLWPRIQHPEKPFRGLSALANESMGVFHEGREAAPCFSSARLQFPHPSSMSSAELEEIIQVGYGLWVSFLLSSSRRASDRLIPRYSVDVVTVRKVRYIWGGRTYEQSESLSGIH